MPSSRDMPALKQILPYGKHYMYDHDCYLTALHTQISYMNTLVNILYTTIKALRGSVWPAIGCCSLPESAHLQPTQLHLVFGP